MVHIYTSPSRFSLFRLFVFVCSVCTRPASRGQLVGWSYRDPVSWFPPQKNRRGRAHEKGRLPIFTVSFPLSYWHSRSTGQLFLHGASQVTFQGFLMTSLHGVIVVSLQ